MADADPRASEARSAGPGPAARGGSGGAAAADRRLSRITVRIHGEEYQVRGDEAPEHVQVLADRLDARMRELSRANPRLGTSQVAVLVALNTMNDLVRLEDQYHRVLALLEREWERRKTEGPPAGASPGGAGGARR